MRNSKQGQQLSVRHILIVIFFGFCAFLLFVFLTPGNDQDPVPDTALYKDPAQPIESRVTDLLSRMTIEEKIGQMALVEKNSLQNIDDISTYHLGGLLSGSGAKPDDNTEEGWREMIATFQSKARETRLGIPLLYGADAIHGHANVPQATVFPHAIGLGATGNPDLVRKIASATAVELKATGVNWNFAPNLDLPRDMRWGRMYESFSDDPQLVSAMGAAYISGLQFDTSTTSVLATPKHFVGAGAMGWDTSLNKNFRIDQGVTEANEKILFSHDILPFEEAIRSGALSIMIGLNTWGSSKMVLQERLLTGVLKNELGFRGFLVSDWYGVHEGRKNIFGATVESVNAGIDMLMLPFDYKTFSWHMKLAYRLGLVSEDRIDDAVRRILRAKFSLGLFDTTETSQNDAIPNEAHQKLARQAVAESLVLLKNDGSLPIAPAVEHIRVAGTAADNVGKQMGAWSIEWQGVDGNWPEETTSILEGIRSRAPQTTKIEYELSGEFSAAGERADLGIAIVGEKPYAEGWGDAEYPILFEEDLKAIENLKKHSDKLVVIIVSGRPLLIENEIDSFDALVAAWLPGSEGGGVADVLFGDLPFTGTLPVPWPVRAEQLPLTLHGAAADGLPLLFPRHFGLKL